MNNTEHYTLEQVRELFEKHYLGAVHAHLNQLINQRIGEPVAWVINVRSENDGEVMYRTLVDQPECPNTPARIGFDTPLYALANTEGE